MSKPTFYDVIEELDFITHVTTRLILAHLVCFYGVDIDVAYLLWVHYKDSTIESIDMLEEYIEGPTPGPSLSREARDKEGRKLKR